MTDKDMTFKAGKTPKAKPAKKAAKKTTAKRTTVKAKSPRRRQRGNLAGAGPLALNMAELDTENYQYRYADLNRPGRLQQLTKQDDYDIVPNNGEQSSMTDGSDVRRPSGEEGMILLRKPREYFEADRKEQARISSEVVDQLKQGSEGRKNLGKNAYIPDDGIAFKEEASL